MNALATSPWWVNTSPDFPKIHNILMNIEAEYVIRILETATAKGVITSHIINDCGFEY